MDDWQPGDDAFCVKASEERKHLISRVFKVRSVFGGGMVIGLRFSDYPDPPIFGCYWDADCFRKVTPREEDESDREVIELMKGVPVDA